ncbi:MAG: hypothetical protein GX896_08470, partial [Clostridiales bacterium]|nr:hypothetical protein [Clostridiales bacterium]
MNYWSAPTYNSGSITYVNKNFFPTSPLEAELIREVITVTPDYDKILAQSEIIIPEQIKH